MLRRPFCGMAAGFLLGILIAAYGGRWFWLTALVCCLGGVSICFWQKRFKTGKAEKHWRKNGCVLLQKGEGKVAASGRIYWKVWLRTVLIALAVLFGWQHYTAELRFRNQYLPYLENNMQLSVQGKLVGKEIRYQQYIYELASCVIQSDQIVNSEKEPVPCNRILVYSDSDFASIGEILVLEGKVELWKRAVNEGNYDEKSFYEARKKDFKLKEIQVKGIYGRKRRLREALWRLRERLKDIYAEAMGEETGGILVNMVLGDKELLEQEIKRIYQVAGLSHIMAISGLHISVIGMSLYQLLRRRGMGFTGAGVVAGTVMYLYGTMVGMGISAQRAVLMFLLQLLAQALGRGYDSLNGLGVAALALLWKNPFLLWDAGTRFSFAAVIGVVWIGKLPKRQGEKKSWEEKIFPGMAIQLVTLPLAAWYYYEIPVYAAAINLVVLPAMEILLTLGVAGGLAGLVSAVLARIVLFPCKVLLWLSTKLCGICAGLPGAMLITGKPDWRRILLYYSLLALLTLYFHRKAKATEEEREKTEPDKVGQSRKADHLQCGRQLVYGLLLLLWLFWPVGKKFELDVLDVGQGDGSYLRTGSGYQIFVDGGSSNVRKVGEYRILPFLKSKGAGKIDYWFVSHTDMDHISGLAELLESGYRVEHLVLSAESVRTGLVEAENMDAMSADVESADVESADAENADIENADAESADAENADVENADVESTDEATAQLLTLAELAGTELILVEQGDVLHLDGAKITILSPAAEEYYADKNAASLVFLYEEDAFSGIFTGDVDTTTERKLLAELKCWTGKIDFYKAAHHGSKYSNSEEFLMALRPAVSVVSCGARNSYGHPGEEAVAHMEDAGSTVFYTMEAGQIKVIQTKAGIEVLKYCNSSERKK